MDEAQLKFEYGSVDLSLVKLEKRIKSEIRRYSLDVPVEHDIERYSDKYSKSLLQTEGSLREIINIELMSPELIKAFGSKKEKKIEDIRGIESSSEEEEEEEIGESEEIEDDYVQNFCDDDDELTTEKNEEGYIF